jgi:hypothetical protein
VKLGRRNHLSLQSAFANEQATAFFARIWLYLRYSHLLTNLLSGCMKRTKTLDTIRAAAREVLTRLFPHLNPATYTAAGFAEKKPSEVFSTIYRKKLWGGRLSLGSCSGSGSRDPAVVAPYIEAVSGFLREIGSPSVIDIGCGDFHVSSQLVSYSGGYIGCDVVDFVIAQNRRKHPRVEFRVLDAVSDELPAGDVVLIRQVLQHLSNQQVSMILPKLCRYRYAVVTEHLPGFADFVPNLDKAAGPDHRVSFGSGLVLTDPPFNLRARRIRVLCEVAEFGGLIHTTLYEQPHL